MKLYNYLVAFPYITPTKPAVHATQAISNSEPSASFAGTKFVKVVNHLIAKLIVQGKTREETLKRMERALEEFVIEGISTTIPLHLRIIKNEDFRNGNFDINFMDRFLESGKQMANQKEE